MGRFLFAMLACCTFSAAPALADDLADGMRAFDAGDYAEARASWERAAASGKTVAMTSLANLYSQGQGVRRDPGMALTYYRMAAERGDAVAQMNLGDLFARSDPVLACMWLGLAAAQGKSWAAKRHEDVLATMTASQIAEAEARIKAWKPKEE